MKNKIKSEAVSKLQQMVNSQGVIMHRFLLQNGDAYILRKNKKGRSVLSKELKNRAGIPQSGIANHDTIIKLADNLNKKMTVDGLHAYVSKLHAPLVSQIGTVGFGSASGALGELLFELLIYIAHKGIYAIDS